MPRQKRINIPGTVHHVIVRGLDGQKLFFDDKDRNKLLFLLQTALKKTECQCYAWALMSNHFHILIRTGGKYIKRNNLKLTN